MNHTAYLLELYKHKRIPLAELDASKKMYDDKGYFTQTYMPIIQRLVGTKDNQFKLATLRGKLKNLCEMGLSRQTELEVLQRTIETTLFYCSVTDGRNVYSTSFSDECSRVYKLFKNLDWLSPLPGMIPEKMLTVDHKL